MKPSLPFTHRRFTLFTCVLPVSPFTAINCLALLAGGEYPLASTITSEGSKTKTRGGSVATVFSMQGWGKLA